ncbi:diguanylate cyclase [Aliiglaciecola sp. LCG003]|uniref:sensor domain-containing diguanylate cyclase n=1 Tax=Aliiglaciecola sp. LCG003 TaxID=3053655 RepID=UPI002572C8D3|nr:diguanylate cyclase [Aliiglaciecola sp. LCG003]WJG09095.1 diguanylate cyclase [Aliiglaciecola sp. LCG003]
MLIKGRSIRYHQTWSIAAICIVALLTILSVSKIGTASTYLYEINKGTLVLKDYDGQYTIETIQSIDDSQWQMETSDVLSYGMSTHPFWFKFSIPVFPSEKSRLLEVDYSMLDEVDVWFYQGDQLLSEYHEGDSYEFEHRNIKTERLLFAIPTSKQSLNVIIRMQTAGTAKLPVRVWGESEYLLYNGEHNLILGLFFGFMAAMTLSNLFFYVTTGSQTFLTYSLYVVSMAVTLATLHGLGFKYIWPDWVWLQSKSIGIFATSTILFVTIFSLQLLNVKANSQFMYKVLKAQAWVLALALIGSLVISYYLYIKIFLVLLCLSVTIVFATGILLWIKGVKIARFYLLAWSALLVSGFLSSFESANIIKVDTAAHYMLMLGAAIETFMLAFALAIVYGQQRDDLFKKQELALIHERVKRENQEATIKRKEEAQEDLEYKVQERTLELEIALRELSETNNELEQQTLTDSLTGIRNRKHFDKKYQAEVRRCRREQTELSVVMLDIDHFKKINDSYGHVVGDEVIKHVASALKANLKRVTDDACRYGGEEFALILPNTDLDGAMQLAERVRQQIFDMVIQADDLNLNVTVSAGVATTVVTSNEDEMGLLEGADKALYQAKRNGRNRVEGFHLHARDSI